MPQRPFHYAEILTMDDGAEIEYRFQSLNDARADMRESVKIKAREFTHESPAPLGSLLAKGIADVDALPQTQTHTKTVPGVRSVRIEKVFPATLAYQSKDVPEGLPEERQAVS